MPDFSEKISVLIDIVTGGAPAALGQLKDRIDAAEGASNKFKTAIGGAGEVLSALPLATVVGAAAGAGAALIKLGNDFTQTALNAKKLSDASGLNVEKASEWIAAADDVGVSTDQITSAFGKAAKAIGMAPAKFEELGVSIAHAKDGTVDMNATFLNAIDTLNGIQDPTKKAALASQLFGKSWAELTPLIDRGSKAITEAMDATSYAQRITNDEVAAKKWQATMDDLSDVVMRLKTDLGLLVVEGLGPALQSIGGLSNRIADLSDSLSSLGGGPLKTVGSALGLWVSTLNPVAESIKGLELAQSGLSAGLDTFKGKVIGAGGGSNAWGNDMLTAGERADKFGISVGTVTSRVEHNKDAMDAYAKVQKIAEQAVIDHDAAVQDAVHFLGLMSGATDEASAKLDAAANAADSLDNALKRLIGGQIDFNAATDAAIASEQAVAAALQSHGATLDENTEKGRANREQIRKSVEDELTYIDAFVKGGGTVQDAGQKVNEYRDRLIDQMVQSGLSRAAAESYINELGLTPENVNTAIELSNVEAAKAAAQAWINKLTNADGNGIPKETITAIQALIDQGSIAEANRQLNALAITRYVHYNAVFQGGDPVAPAAGIQHSATGRLVGGPMLSMLGESGSEVVLNEHEAASILWALGNGAAAGIEGPVTGGRPAVRGLPIDTSTYGVSADPYSKIYKPGRMAGLVPGAGGPNYYLTVNAGMGTDGAAVGRQVIKAIQGFELANGSAWRS